MSYFPIFQTLVPVARVTDLPPAVAGVITLHDNTNYIIAGEIALGTDRIVFGVRSAISGTNRVNDRLVYTGSGTMLTATSGAVSVVFNEVGLRCASGTLCSFADCGVAFIDCSIGPCASGGNFAASGAFSWTFRQGSISSGFTTGGFTFTGTSTGTCRVFDNTIANNAGTLLALGTAVFGVVDISRNVALVNVTQTFLSGTGATNVSIAGHLANNTFSGAGTAVSGIANSDTPWIWTDNSGVTNTPGGGSVGATGPAGPPGIDGRAGAMGFPGQSGAPGAVGATGATGSAGLTVPGLDGRAGRESFIPGPQGVAGALGPAGASVPGRDGKAGPMGLPASVTPEPPITFARNFMLLGA